MSPDARVAGVAGKISWSLLAEQLGLIENEPDGWNESGGSGDAQRALEQVVGEDEMRAAVDYYVTGEPGCELARSVLWLLKPRSAMVRCREIASTSGDPEVRRSAVELLRVVADRTVMSWIPEYLADPDEGVQIWGIGILDQLLWDNAVEPEEAESLLLSADQHQNAAVRERAQFIRSFLTDRATSD